MSNAEFEMNGNDDVAERFGGAAQAELDRMIEVENDASPLSNALDWASVCDAGDYLVEYNEAPDNRCGYGDDELDAIRRALAERDLTLIADYRGLVAQAVRS